MKGIIETQIVVGPFACNCRVLVCEKTRQAVVIDPGDEADKIQSILLKNDVQVTHLLHTHAHLDHIGATSEIANFCNNSNKEKQNNVVLIAMHADDKSLYDNLPMQGKYFGREYSKPIELNMFLEQSQIIEVGEFKIRVIHTPGHSPGGVCFEILDHNVCYTGDTLFRGAIGRTDLWGSNHAALMSSIENRLFCLPKITRICPGHGEESTIGQEIVSNPFFT